MKKRSIRPLVEVLEDRWNPALLLQLDSGGNLVAIFGVPDGDVLVEFQADNEVYVEEDGNDLGTYEVAGNLSISLGNSALAAPALDVDFGSSTLSGSLKISAGNALNGYDITVIGDDGGTIEGNLSITSGNGPDTIAVTDMTVEGSTSINGGGGDDTATVDPTLIEGNLTVTGVQTFDLVDSDVEGNFSFDSTREALDAIVTLDVDSSIGGNVSIRTGGGDDTVSVNTTVLGNLVMTTGSGDDDVNSGALDEFTVLGSLTYTAGAGDDELNMEGTIFGNVTANMGTGDDDVGFGQGIASTVLGSAITLVMGSGDDTLLIGASGLTAPGARLTFLGQNGVDTFDWTAAATLDLWSAYLDGGFGTDIFDTNGNVFTFPVTVRNFS
jgi:hypothetical protein